jgi:hypothetical protein
VLEQAGLISRRRRATTRFSHLEAEPLRAATAWLARYQAYWDESYDRLDMLLRALHDEASDDRSEAEPRKGSDHGHDTDYR